MDLGNLGKINQKRLESLAKSAGISREELARKMAEHGLSGLTYRTGSQDR